MKCWLALVALTLLVGSPAARGAPPGAVGVRDMTASSPEGGAAVHFTLWYPAAPGGTPALIGDNAIFKGVMAEGDAPVMGRALPLILLSHGGSRAAPSLGVWIASWLAARGFVVALAQQPDPRSETAAASVQDLWRRPADLSSSLTAIESDPVWRRLIDTGRIGVLGFLRGGTAALELAGARLDAERYARSCDPGGSGLDCAWLAKGGVDLHDLSTAQLAGSHLDRRIKVAVVIDAELSASFTRASLASISIPVRIINLGSPGTVLPGLDGSGLGHLIPGAGYTTLPDATRFSSFGECKPGSSEKLSQDGGDEVLCADGGSRSRAEIHTILASAIAVDFNPIENGILETQGNPPSRRRTRR